MWRSTRRGLPRLAQATRVAAHDCGASGQRHGGAVLRPQCSTYGRAQRPPMRCAIRTHRCRPLPRGQGQSQLLCQLPVHEYLRFPVIHARSLWPNPMQVGRFLGKYILSIRNSSFVKQEIHCDFREYTSAQPIQSSGALVMARQPNKAPNRQTLHIRQRRGLQQWHQIAESPTSSQASSKFRQSTFPSLRSAIASATTGSS